MGGCVLVGGCIYSWVGVYTAGWVYIQLGGCIYSWVGVYTAGWVYIQLGGCIYSWVGVCILYIWVRVDGVVRW